MIVIVGEAEKLLHTLNIFRWLPVEDSSHLVGIHTQLARTNHMPKILDIWLAKFTFFEFGL